MRIGVLAAAADVLQGKQLFLRNHQIAAPALQEQLSLCTDVLKCCCTLCPEKSTVSALCFVLWVCLYIQEAAEDMCSDCCRKHNAMQSLQLDDGTG